MMKNGFFFFIGLLAAFVFGWAGIALGSHKQLGSLTPFYDDGEGSTFPARPQGLAARGQLVYANLGCASCHTQQVRRPDFGSDKERGWGERQSVARDYIFQVRPQLGESRIGPDLANLAGRKPPLDATELSQFLYSGIISGAKVATHPPYKFLFDDRASPGETSVDALPARFGAAPGRQLVATERARTLVAYLQSLNTSYEFPEARPVMAAAAKEAAHK
jgi:cytochrome c oxidase cbb3-type subunit 2